MTYTALACLVILGDDLSRVNRDAITASLRQLQQENGSFCPNWGSDERDMRFLYCACTISFMLNDWRGMDVDRALAFIRDSQTYEYAFGQGPGQEAHGGSTYCAVASLSLMNRLDELKGRDQLIHWLLTRQVDGFNGRPNKPRDTCYSFWIGASLDLLGVYHLVDTDTLKQFLKTTHTKYGGFGKGPGDYPDLLHSYMGLAGLAITKDVPGLAELHTGLGLTARSMKHLNEKTVLSHTRAM
ncbi:hypothetical protein SpCBS45565_g01640 [Spizellomyces sp. 'palustris']|nr:hypothetical protein SpCBS45565_g01640 [Spizellomyces sp. 'palustris']